MSNDTNILESITIKTQMRKNPHLYKHFMEMASLPVNRKFTESDIVELYLKTKKYASLIKVKKFNLMDESSFESIEDKLNEMILKNEAEKLCKSFISNKYKHLFSDEVHNLFDSLHHNNIEREQIAPYLNKIASYESSNRLVDTLKKCLEDNTNSNISSIINKIKKENLNVNIVYVSHKEQLLILKINDYFASKALGSSSWCISYSPRYFNMYINKKTKFDLKANQFFAYDFSAKDETNSLLGATVSLGSLIFAADKRDRSIGYAASNNESRLGYVLNKIIELNLEKYHNKDQVIKSSIKKIMGNNEKTLKYLTFVLESLMRENLSFSEENLILLFHCIERFTQKGLAKKSFKLFSKIFMNEVKNGYKPSKEMIEAIATKNKGFAIKLAYSGIKVADKHVKEVVSN